MINRLSITPHYEDMGSCVFQGRCHCSGRLLLATLGSPLSMGSGDPSCEVLRRTTWGSATQTIIARAGSPSLSAHGQGVTPQSARRRWRIEHDEQRRKTKIMASNPFPSWRVDGQTMETMTGFIFSGSKITVDSDCSHEIKRRKLLGRKAMTSIDSI